MTKAKKRRILLAALALAALLAVLAALPVYRQVQRRLYPVRYAESVLRWAETYALDPYLVYAFIRTESNFDPRAESSAGARGLMQMTGETFDWLKTRIAPDEPLDYDDMYDPDLAIRFGCCLIALSLQRYGGDISTAAAAYHSGWGTVDGLLAAAGEGDNTRVLDEFPYQQMQHYVYKINACYQKYLEIYA